MGADIVSAAKSRAQGLPATLKPTMCGVTMGRSDNGGKIDRVDIILIILLSLRDSSTLPLVGIITVENNFLVTHCTYLFSGERNVEQRCTDRAQWKNTL